MQQLALVSDATRATVNRSESESSRKYSDGLSPYVKGKTGSVLYLT